MRYRLKTFLILTGLLVAASIGWQLWRYESHFEERARWDELADSLRAQKTSIDSLETVLAGFDERVERGKTDLGDMQRRLAHYERQASSGRLPTPQYRQYMRTIDAHNEIVARHNDDLGRMQRIYRAYSTLIDRHNALIDSANALQRRAVQQGYALPDFELDR